MISRITLKTGPASIKNSLFIVLTAFVAFVFSSNCFASELSFENLQSLIVEKDIRSIEELLKNLPTSFKANFTLMRESQSRQKASPLEPRAILFSRDGELLMAFNGNKQHSGYNDLEVIHWRQDERKFELRRIHFAPDAKAPAKVSEANPVTCTRCHGKDPRPIFNDYNDWDGAYGQKDDRLGSEKAWAKFANSAKEHPRYKHLMLTDQEGKPPFWTSGNERTLKRMPNTRLTGAISYRLVDRMRRLLNSSQHRDLLPLHAYLHECLIHIPEDGDEPIRQSLKAYFQRSKLPVPEYLSSKILNSSDFHNQLAPHVDSLIFDRKISWTSEGFPHSIPADHFHTGSGGLESAAVADVIEKIVKEVPSLARYVKILSTREDFLKVLSDDLYYGSEEEVLRDLRLFKRIKIEDSSYAGSDPWRTIRLFCSELHSVALDKVNKATAKSNGETEMRIRQSTGTH